MRAADFQGIALALTLRGMQAEARTARVWRRTLSWMLCFALFSCATVTGAAAQPAAARPEVSSLTLFGVEAVDEGRLTQVLETRASSWLPWGVNRYFDPEALQRDLQRIVAFYRDHGYRDARVVSHDVAVDENTGHVSIDIVVEEGEPVRVRELAFDGFESLDAEALETLRRRVPVERGEPLVHQDVVAGGEMAVHALQDRGYPHAEVRVFEEQIEPGWVRVRYRAEPGAIAYFGEIEVAGNKSVEDYVIRRELGYKPGELFRRSRLEASQRQLAALDLFEFATVQTLKETPYPSEVPTRVTVAEGKPTRTQYSIGYGTEEKVRGEISWRHVNFFGGARSFTARGRWSSLDRGGQVDFVQPYFYHPRLTLSFDGHDWFTDETAFDVRSRGGRTALSMQVARHLSGSVTFGSEYQSSSITEAALNDPTLRDELIALGLDPTTGKQEGVLTTLGLELQRNTTTNRLDPSDGTALSFALQQAGGWLPGTYHFVNVMIEGRAYRPWGERVVFAGRLRAGAIDPFGPASNIPFFRRYFLGGSSSLRGWGRFEISPLSESGQPIGGQSLLEASAEMRVRAMGNLGAAFFLDAGRVWPGAWSYALNDLLYDAGAGIRYYSPVGPLRLDLAYQLTPLEGLRIDGQPQSRRWRVHFSIGQAF